MNTKNIKQYLDNKVNPLFEQLLADTYTEDPANIYEYMITWFDKVSPNLEQVLHNKIKTRPEGIDTSSEESNEDDVDEMPALNNKVINPKRSSVSAESYGRFNKIEDIKLTEYEKSESETKKIIEGLNYDFIFSALNTKEKEELAKYLQIKNYKAGDIVINQGDKGDEMFIISTGKLKCEIVKNGKVTFFKEYLPGESFGELALLYNSPRAATITCNDDSQLFTLSRDVFNLKIKEKAKKRREQYEEFLKNNELFDSLDSYERHKISDCFIQKTYEDGDIVIKEGDSSDDFYLIISGKCIAKQYNKISQANEIVYEFKAGDYFGELALLNESKRKATIYAKGNLIVIMVNKDAFKRLLGPIKDILKRNMDRYNKYITVNN